MLNIIKDLEKMNQILIERLDGIIQRLDQLIELEKENNHGDR